ncbi:MAG: hypothetical protein AB7O44_18220 [Hyphomicrobiaceae bacterium]
MRIRRLPTWPECLLIVLAGAAVTAGLNHYMLQRQATFLDEQMAHVSKALGTAARSVP